MNNHEQSVKMEQKVKRKPVEGSQEQGMKPEDIQPGRIMLQDHEAEVQDHQNPQQDEVSHALSRAHTVEDDVHETDEQYHAIPRTGLDTHYEIPRPPLEPAPSYYAENDPHGIPVIVTPVEESVDVTPVGVPPIVVAPKFANESNNNSSTTVTERQSEDDPAPPYSETLGMISQSDSNLGTKADVADDGRVNIRINQRNAGLSNLLSPVFHAQGLEDSKTPPPKPYIPPSLGGEPGELPPPSMNVVIMVVGSRGDVQPFVALGKVLVDTYGHRVRLATHAVFQNFVEENGLEFFNIGGDPAELMAFMVKNPGLMPGLESLRAGDVAKRRKGIAEMIRGCWRACFEAGDGLGVEVTDETVEEWMHGSDDADEMSEDARRAAKSRPFVADVIIANPPSFAHIHCGERLGIPVHIMFTMPWSPTRAFPHPLANIVSSNADGAITNLFSYTLVDMLTWQGLGDLINRFRLHTLSLEPISAFYAPGMMSRLRIPHTYCWSPALIPKPSDWGPHISLAGFYFLSLASNFTPEPELAAFLEAGPPPVYIGFGSIVVDDPNAMTNMIFEAIKLTGQRALVSKGWGGLGADELGIPDGVFMLGNIPHDWLFQRVSCVVHHGGAGTTAAGIACGKPTVVVPFFGDQPFWGAMVARAGAGPSPIPYKELTAEKLADQINFAIKPESQDRAKDMATQISRENGNQKGAQAFHQFLPMEKMRCAIFPKKAAVWRVKRTQIRLSAVAAYTLFDMDLLTWDDLKLHRVQEYETDLGPSDPVTGGAAASIGFLSSAAMAVADLPVETLKRLGIGIDVDPTEPKPKRQSRHGSHSFHFPNRSGSIASKDRNETSETKGKGKQNENSSQSVFGPASPVTSPMTSATISRVTSPETASLNETLYTTTTTSTEEDDKNGHENEDPHRTSSITPISPHGEGSERSLSVPSNEIVASPIEMNHRSLLNEQRGRSESQSSMAEAIRAVSRRGASPWRKNKGRDSLRSHSPHPTEIDSNSGQPITSPHHRDSSLTSPSLVNDQRCDPLDTIYGTGKGLGRLIGAGLKSPMDITLAISKGFHNMPRMYGEEVRQVDRVTGIQSGFKTATKEFGVGLFEGITGLVTQPIMGAKAEGVPGFFKGAARGVAGLIVKPGAAAHALPAYAMLGVYKEIQKRFGENVGGYIVAARVAQGYGEWMGLGEDTRKETVRRFMEKLSEVRGHRGLGGQGSVNVAKEGGIEKMKSWIDDRREKRRVSKLQKVGKASEEKQKKLHKSRSVSGPTSSTSAGTSTSRRGTMTATQQARDAQQRQLDPLDDEPLSDDEDQDLEEAVRLSLRAHELGHGIPSFASTRSSTITRTRSPSVLTQTQSTNTLGHTEEDPELQKAINASLEDLKLNHSAQSHDNEALTRAMQESLSLQRAPTESLPPSYSRSVTSEGQTPTLSTLQSRETDGLYTDDDDEQLKLAIAESHKSVLEEEERAKREEEIVMNFVKKQSMAEEQFKKRN